MTDSGFFSEQSEQSLVKAEIVQKYFFAWANVLKGTVRAQRDGRLAYIDLFAGPGRYEDGKASVPLLVLNRAVEDDFLSEHLVCRFNDKDDNNTRTLENEIAAIPGIEKLKYAPKVSHSEVGTEIVAQFESIRMIPTFFFVDPWGYKGLSLQLINSVVKNWGCDCVFFFNYNRINMGITNPFVQEHMAGLYGQARLDELKLRLSGKRSAAREALAVESLAEALKSYGSRYVLPFTFKFDTSNRTSHYLIFVTKHIRGYEVMKEIMARASSIDDDGIASFSYCNAVPETPLLFEFARPLSQLAELLTSTFAGKTMTMLDVYNQHHVDRPFVKSNYKDALKQLEAQKRISCNPLAESRRKGTMADNVKISFSAAV